jgi:U6 snRNA-associated Sm-like protein LSm7
MNNGILDLNPHLGKSVRVTFQGGREVVGILRGFDPMVNIVIDDSVEFLRSDNDPYKASGKTRKLGRVVCRGNNVTMCAPEEGYESIANPFLGAEEEGEEVTDEATKQ